MTIDASLSGSTVSASPIAPIRTTVLPTALGFADAGPEETHLALGAGTARTSTPVVPTHHGDASVEQALVADAGLAAIAVATLTTAPVITAVLTGTLGGALRLAGALNADERVLAGTTGTAAAIVTAF